MVKSHAFRGSFINRILFFRRGWLALIFLVGFLAQPASTAQAASLPPGFQETIAFSGLVNPTVIQFSPDGRIFVAEKRGMIKVFDSLADATPDVFADLNTNVYNFWDRGLLGMALDPGFPANPYVYVLYTHDAAIGGTAPRWGTTGVYSDPCPTPPGATGDGCVVSGRLSRLQANGNAMTGAEQVLIEDWCQQYPSHSTGSLAFGSDGALYVSGGDGASFNFVDYGQDGSPLNPCGDPPTGAGTTLTPPSAEGGALRSQDLRTSGDPVSLDGAILRVDPATGAGLPNNPLAASSDPNARRIIAYGLRNPFRITVRPNNGDIWIGDVGWSSWEEINRIPAPADSAIENFGWPCYEGNNRQSGYDGANLNICEGLYSVAGAVTAPYYTYHHNNRVVPNETCPTGSSSVAGMSFQFYTGSAYPNEYNGALFFADYSRDCIWAMLDTGNGSPNPSSIRNFVAGAANPVDIKISPAGELFYADFDGGTIRRVTYISPVAVASANPVSGNAPLTVNFDGSASSGNGVLSYAWDLDGDGAFDDAAAALATYTYNSQGTYQATLRVTDSQGVTATDTVVITVSSNQPPVAVASANPTTGTAPLTVNFNGSGSSDPDPGDTLSFAWDLDGDGAFDDASTAQATFTYSNAGTYPASLRVADGQGASDTDTVSITITAANSPPTAVVSANPTTGTAPLTVNFDGSGSSDPNPGDTLSFAWDLDGDGAFDDASTAQAAFTYTIDGTYTAALRVTDSLGASATDAVVITVAGNTPPTATINSPAPGTLWSVDQVITFSGSPSDAQEGNLPASALTWSLIMQHCPSNCHTHPIQDFAGVASGSFSAPDHEYPSYLELRLTATDSGGLQHTQSLRLDPRTVVLTFQTSPGGLQLVVNSTQQTASFTRTVIVGSRNSVSALSPQTKGKFTYQFRSWSDGGAQAHDIIAPASATTYTARFRR